MLVAAYLLAVFITIFAAIALVTFSPIRQVRQPARSLLLGFCSSGMAGLCSIPLALFGDRKVWLGLFFIGMLITGIGGVLIGLLGSTEGSAQKQKTTSLPNEVTTSGGAGEVEPRPLGSHHKPKTNQSKPHHLAKHLRHPAVIDIGDSLTAKDQPPVF